ncbi:hypothetical protein E8E12_000501 [Didymella heteroderae]|uniref:Transmembrane protein n=1 Tax=Didymella heteroderae TaxID=1769908 RepID=A0A9P4WIP6_9PLEO|nr:hypothetical protein E8E12_000501 [Didymella heteroderae]
MVPKFCADGPPTELASEPDISGIGVTVAYSTTATIALLLVVANYIFVYHPDASSAAEREGIKHDHPSKINPIDEYILHWRLGKKREVRGIERWGERGLRVRNALTHAMLTMSDFQLITGLSILISGFTQLDTGISAYHWQRLVQLAWFSSITHLCCLTALRNYFRRNTLGYSWRLPGMIILIVMLVIALIPTGHYTWESQTIRYGSRQHDVIRPRATDHAICYFNHHEGKCTMDEWYEVTCEQVFQASQQRMILSAVFLAVGMCNRLWHLCRLPSQLYISARFIWGLLNLWMRPTLHEDGTDTWTFGQVMALLVVFAPLITLVEGYVKATTHNVKGHDHMVDMVDGIEFLQVDSRAPSSLIGLVAKHTARGDDFINPHPNHDYYNDRFSFPILVYATLIGAAATSCLLLVALRTQDVRPSDVVQPGSATSFRFFLVPPLPVLLGYLGLGVLLSLVFEIRRPKGRSYRYWCRFLHFFFFIGIFILPSFGYIFVTYFSMICAAIYLVVAISHIVRRYKLKRKIAKAIVTSRNEH